MPAISRLVVGLGNPGKEYADTRHNIGFMAADAIAERYGCASWKKKFKGEAATCDDGFLLLKPMTFMNLSGEAVGEAMRFHKLIPDSVIVLHDDLDLEPGQVKIKQGGGSGGHNGLKSIDQHIGQDYWRVRLGIGRPLVDGVALKGEAVTDYVLSPFAKADKTWLSDLLDVVAGKFDLMLKGDTAEYLHLIADKLKKAD